MYKRQDYAGALRLLRKRPQDPEGYPRALTVSAMEERGLGDVWDQIGTLAEWRRAQGHWDRTRRQQATSWFHDEVRAGVLARLDEDPQIQAAMTDLAEQVACGTLAVSAAAEQILDRLRSGG